MIINEHNLGHYIVPRDVSGICVDIGANVGAFIKQNHNKFETVYAYEPITVLYEKIKSYNIENVILYNEAVLDECTETEVILHNNNESGSSSIKKTLNVVIERKMDWSSTVINQVKTIDIDEVIKRTNAQEINYLKMDCENSEYLILNNKDLSKIKYIGIELHCQMGEQKWTELKKWIEKTHSGFPEWCNDHREVLLQRIA